jgi:hypothetical protein
MKIVDFQRTERDITAVLEDGREVALTWDYIAANKPQVGDEYAEAETTTE